MNPSVSVIIPVYNHASFVEQALDSVRSQTWTDWELVIIDDGSSDRSADVVKAWLDRAGLPQSCLVQQVNQGSHAAINAGMRLARGRYLAILNSDDRFHPKRLAQLMDSAAAAAGRAGQVADGREPFVAFTEVRLVDQLGLPIADAQPDHWWLRMYGDLLQRWHRNGPSGQGAALQSLLWGNLTVSTSNLFISRGAWEQLGPFGRLRYVPDWEYALRAALALPAALQLVGEGPLLDYRLHGGNTILGGALRNHVEAAHVLRRVHRRMARKGWAAGDDGILRLRLLDRFIRQESVRARDLRLRGEVWQELKTSSVPSAQETCAAHPVHQPPAASTLVHVIKLERLARQEAEQQALDRAAALAGQAAALAEQAASTGWLRGQLDLKAAALEASVAQAHVLQQHLQEQVLELQAMQAQAQALQTRLDETAAALQTSHLERAELEHQMAHRTAELEHQLAQRAAELQSSLAAAAELKGQVDRGLHDLQAMRMSRSWRLTAPVRAGGDLARKIRSLVRSSRDRVQRATALTGRAWRVWRTEGWSGVAQRLGRRGLTPAPALVGTAGAGNPSNPGSDPYDDWLQTEQQRVQRLCAQAGERVTEMPDPPLISVVVPVYNTSPPLLQAMVESVRAQCYAHWELCLVDDASDNRASCEALQRVVALDSRIRLHRRAVNGHIAQATNDGLAMARGQWVALLDHDDALPPHALLRMAQEIQTHPCADVLYSDEDKIDLDGRRSLPLFKPDWSPALLWSQNYVGHFLCVRRERLMRLGGFSTGVDGSQDHDLVLRLSADGAVFHHVPEILYHWRQHPASTSTGAQAKPYAHDAGRQAVQRHLQQRYPAHFSHMEEGPDAFVYRPRFRLPTDTLVSVIIPTRDRVDLLRPCVASILDRSTGVPFEVLVLDNGSAEPATHAYFETITRQDSRVRVIRADFPFNWSRLNNVGIEHARGDVLVFLNNDTLVISEDWMARLAETALLPDVGTVGPMLLFEDGTVQHAGVVVGMGGWADHVYRCAHPVNYPTPFIANVVTRNVLACTGACVAVSRAVVQRIGGFDEAFQICGSDVEIGIRAHRAGLQNIYLPTVRLYHLESKSRSPHVPECDFIQSELKYAPYRLSGDPFYNVNLDPMSQQPRARHPDSIGAPA